MIKRIIPVICFVILVSVGCTPRDNIAPVLPSALFPKDDFSIASYKADVEPGYFWLLCADEKFYYAAGDQELMDDASRPVRVYSYDPTNGESKNITLPRGDDWHLYNMVPAKDGGFWMVFTPLTPNSMMNYISKPAHLVKTDKNYREILSIDLSDYSQDIVNIMGVYCPKSSNYAQEAMEELGYTDAPRDNFFKAALACDSNGRVYITSARENVVVFDENGEYLGEFNIYDVEYSNGTYLIPSSSGRMIAGRSNADGDVSYVVLDVESFEVSKPFTHSENESKILKELHFSPIPALMSEYEICACGYYGLFGVKFADDQTYTLEPLLYYENNGLPQDIYGKLIQFGDTRELVFEKRLVSEDSGEVSLYFYIVSMKK